MIKINSILLDGISGAAKISLRKRKNYNFHNTASDPLQRMLNALELETYVRPHKHVNPEKREVFILLRGKIAVVEFDDDGNISDHMILDHSHGNYAAEIIPASWHTIISFESGSVYYEVKDGPYNLKNDKVFASWSPDEGSVDIYKYLNKIIENIELL